MPNNTSIGGSGTCVPELVLVLLELEVDELVELDVDELVELDVDVLEVTFPEVEVLVDTLPEVEDELPPVEVEVDEPPVEVEVELPLTLTVTPLLLPLVVVVELIETWPPPLEPPKKPPKKPPPKPPPLEPPITIGTPPPLTTGAGAAGSGTGAIANCCTSTQTFSPLRSTSCRGASHSRVTMRLMVFTRCGTVRRTVLVCLTGLVVLTSFTDLTFLVSAAGASATWTAPPTASAPPAATADSFARAILTEDMVCSLSFDGIRLTDPKWPARLHPFTPRTGQSGGTATGLTMNRRSRSEFFGSIPRVGPGLSHSETEPGPIPKRC